MNVLVDRHHAGLYRSMQLLADRLGWTLYTPIGLEWFDEGYWQFGAQHLGRALAEQYLAIADGVWIPFDDGYLTHDPEFPLDRIYGVTLAHAREMDWAYVVATVQDNQQGFRRFADETGAGYVLQVGNTNQYIDWSLDPMAIVSSEVPILGRGVVVHQEMDPAVAEYDAPTFLDRRIIRSFVNCFPSIQCAPALDKARTLLPEFLFAVYGIDGPEGVIKPATKTASLMGASGFGWHDKAHGDGFGHVLHMWAAVGRPLIGHGYHYAGKMGEVFWRHGETCIDLDKLPFADAMAMVREIANDPVRHARMCHAIRAVYDTIDYALEADAIADLLGMKVLA